MMRADACLSRGLTVAIAAVFCSLSGATPAMSRPDGLDPVTGAYVDAMPVRPAPDRIRLIDRFVSSVKDILPKLDLLYLTAGSDKGSIAVNLVAPGHFTLKPRNDPVFEPDRGIHGDGRRSCFDTGFSPVRDARRMDAQSAELGVFVLSNDFMPTSASPVEAGNRETLVKALETLRVFGTPTTVGGRITRGVTLRAPSRSITTAIGLTSVMRGFPGTDGSAEFLYRNGGRPIARSGGSPDGLGEASYVIGGYNRPDGSRCGGSIRRIGAFYAGAPLAEAERNRLYKALSRYLAAVGAYDPAEAKGPPYKPPPPDPYAPLKETYRFTEKYRGTPLDLAGYRVIFEDGFDSVGSITDDEGKGPWFAPVHTTVGAATFMAPSHDPSPFSVSGGVLTIRAERVDGEWQTGHMQTMNSEGRGFARKYGYFEIRAKLPPPGTTGAWPAFWLYSADTFQSRTQPRAEIDGLEYDAGGAPLKYASALHLRPAQAYRMGDVSRHWGVGMKTREEALADGGWHRHGIMVTPDWIVIYMDGRELRRVPTPPQFKVPLFILVSNQLISRQAPRAVSPIDFKVDYVRVWAKK